LILEWSKGLYAPFSFLQDIIKRLNSFSNEQSIILEYSGQSILNSSTVNWKYYESFKEDLLKKKDIKFFIIYYVSNLDALISRMREAGISNDECSVFKNIVKVDKAFCIENKLSNGRCIVCIDGNKVSKHNHADIETVLDHELNHYFKRYDNESDGIENLAMSEKIAKIGEDIGYDLHNASQRRDFVNHILNRDEFVSMVSNVCNVLSFKLNEKDKYDWLVSHSTASFILSDEYKKLHQDLQNILLFSTICRMYSAKRWSFLKKKVKMQLDYRETFIHSVKSGIMTFIERLKA